jgi:2-polyprenyl-3-methyl-5-hydroxy-6-metoxy-1,4-benzoquinol methylase
MLTVDFRKIPPVAGEWLLDAGCGEGRHTLALCRMGCRVFALDRDQAPLRRAQYFLKDMDNRGEARGPVMVLRGDNLQLPFGDGTFHKIICAEVLEHVTQDRLAVHELLRVLRDGGAMAVTVPTPFTETVYRTLSRQYFRTPGGHIRIYRPKELCGILTEAGLRIYAVGFAHAFHSFYWVLKCLCGLENEHARIPKAYHHLLHQVVKDPILKWWERSCNYLFPKSMVIYARKIGRSS